jgi:hypothetical protein
MGSRGKRVVDGRVQGARHHVPISEQIIAQHGETTIRRCRRGTWRRATNLWQEDKTRNLNVGEIFLILALLVVFLRLLDQTRVGIYQLLDLWVHPPALKHLHASCMPKTQHSKNLHKVLWRIVILTGAFLQISCAL